MAGHGPCCFGGQPLDPLAVKVYDRYIIPIIAKLESLRLPPVGQNLLVIAQKIRMRP